MVFGEYRDKIIITQLSDGNQGPILEVVEDVYDLCFLGEFGGKEDCCASRRLDVGAIFYLYGRPYQCRLDVCKNISWQKGLSNDQWRRYWL